VGTASREQTVPVALWRPPSACWIALLIGPEQPFWRTLKRSQKRPSAVTTTLVAALGE
jgi:hypothetical protein